MQETGVMASVEVLTGPERRRRWSNEQKQAIIAAAFKPGAVVRDVARQAGVTQPSIHRSTSKPAASMSKESCSRDGNAICDWEEWTGPSAMIGY